MEFEDFLKIYKDLYIQFLQIKNEVNYEYLHLKYKLEDLRFQCGDDLDRYNKLKNAEDKLILRLNKNYWKKVYELDKEWNTLPAIIVPTCDLYEEVANYLKVSLHKSYRPEVHTYSENGEIKMYYTINLGDKELFKSDVQTITEKHKKHETIMFDINNVYPSQKDVRSLKIYLYKNDYKDVFGYRLERMSPEEKEEYILNAHAFNVRRNEYLQKNLPDLTFEELNEFLITVGINYGLSESVLFLGKNSEGRSDE